MPLLPDARTPRGLRIYAIGDVHGCLGQLRDVYRGIDEDLATRPCIDWRIVHLGDYVDRGPESRACLDLVIEKVKNPRVYALFGNHEQQFLDFLMDPQARSFENWMNFGGRETLAAYGVNIRVPPVDDPEARAALHDALMANMPTSHLTFLGTLPHMLRFGDFVFVHAGVRPGVALQDQSMRDLAWIREPFLSSDGDFGAVVVHGHTPTDQIERRPNRIGIDTGAVFGGPLTCLVLEDDTQLALQVSNVDLLT